MKARSLRVIVFDGPPASGKTTLSKVFAEKTFSPLVSYKAFGPFNVFSKIFLRSSLYYLEKQGFDLSRFDPLLLLPREVASRISIIMVLFEVFYKLFQQLRILIILLCKGQIIIDEFLIIRNANYVNVIVHKILSKRLYRILFGIDIAFLMVLDKIARITYIYFDVDRGVLQYFWRKRGHRAHYDQIFLLLVRISHKHLWGYMSRRFRLDLATLRRR